MKISNQRFHWKFVPHVCRLEEREMPGSILAGGSALNWSDSALGLLNLEPGLSDQPTAEIASRSQTRKHTGQMAALTPQQENPVAEFAGIQSGERTMALLGSTVESHSASRDGSIQGIYISYWYNGDFDNRNFLPNESNTTVGDARVYDNFIVPGPGNGPVECICLLYVNEFMNFKTRRANWELREWVGPQYPGIVIASGTDWPATAVPTGRSFMGLDEYRIEVDLAPFPVYVPAGQFWLNVTPVGQGHGVGFIGTTSGQNGYGMPPGNDGNSYIDSRTFGFNFEPTTTPLGKGTWDFSMGLDTMPMN